MNTDRLDRKRVRIAIHGAVQGVGFRPFVHALAGEFKLCGWVQNISAGVLLEVEGAVSNLETFVQRLNLKRPERAIIYGMEVSHLDPKGYRGFAILSSDQHSQAGGVVLPDIAMCGECLRELHDSSNRRYRYPFINCTHCGPRFSIIERIPYDRRNTTMKKFKMCEDCRTEYEDPGDRRFHAQPISCPHCGPQLECWDSDGKIMGKGPGAVGIAIDEICLGRIVAVKGLGGFHLVADARSEDAVRRLRSRKHREEKPFALMYPSLKSMKKDCVISPEEERVLASPEAPIVLVRRKDAASVAASIAHETPWLGVMLPYTPIHHLLLSGLISPIVATSGNLSDEPICTDEHRALDRLQGIADLFLVHNRPIARHVDDSIVRVILGREQVLRRARGYAPLPVRMSKPLPSILAVGAQLKSTIAVTEGSNVFVSQHVGDLETPQSFECFQQVCRDLPQLVQSEPSRFSADLHPDYLSTKHALKQAHPVELVQHHHAHIVSCMAENDLSGSVLGVAWDGTGYGGDDTIWGGEFLRCTQSSFDRVGHLERIRLPGGESAIREPRRTAIGALYELFGSAMTQFKDLPPLESFTSPELATLLTSLDAGVNAPMTSSVGRLFDAVSSLAGLAQRSTYEGQAAMKLEFAMEGCSTNERYRMPIVVQKSPSAGAPRILQWRRMILSVLMDVRAGTEVGVVAARFHNALVESIVEMAQVAGEERVVLSGGCFQNRYLIERAILRLREAGFFPYWHQRIPTNDGGIALGQAVVAGARNEQSASPASADRNLEAHSCV